MIWQRFDEEGESLTLEDLRALFPDEPTVQVKELLQTSEMAFQKESSE